MTGQLNEWLPPYAVYALLGLLALAVLWLVYRRYARPKRTLKTVIAAIAHKRMSNVVIPKADEGEILIDQLLLTSAGLLVLDIKDVQGVVFGSDKMQDWTVMGEQRRYTFSNPQTALYDRIAAVRQIVREVPVSGRLLFLDGAEFTKGVPSLVCDLDELLDEYQGAGTTAATAQIDAFLPHWERIKKAALHTDSGSRRRRAAALRG